MSRNYLITTPIYYVNDRPHIGHAYTSIAADFLSRFHRLAGQESFFLTGTDEHGAKVAEAAAAVSKSPQQLCDEVVEEYKETWRALGLNYDYFVRTTDARHIQAVTRFLTVLNNASTPEGQKAVYEGMYDGLYCTGCEKFLTESDMADGLCIYHKSTPQPLKEKNYFFRLAPYLPIIRSKIEKNELVIMPDERRREVLGLLNMGLPDFSISRESVTWGIPLPFDPSQVAYVWVDALPNYISAIGYGDNPAQFDKWWDKAEVVHLMAKEILKFHTIYWPAMLMAAGLKLPEKIFIHGFFTVNGEKMGKSAGNMLDPRKMVAVYGADATRYLLLNQYPFGIDGDIKEKEFAIKYNADLANDLGNLVSRIAKMMVQYCDGKVPPPCDNLPGQKELIDTTVALSALVFGYVNDLRITDAIGAVLNLIRDINRFVESSAPWKLAKEGRTDAVDGVLYAAAEALRVVTILLHPMMPGKTREIRAVFALDDATLSLKSAQTPNGLPVGNKINIKESVFPRLDASKMPTLISVPLSGKTAEAGLITLDDFGKAKLRVALVEAAERVPKADRLLCLQINIGNEKRQIVAGVAEEYSPETIIGKKIIVVTNLMPAKIRGIESYGMLLAAKKDGRLVLVTVDGDIAPGASVG